MFSRNILIVSALFGIAQSLFYATQLPAKVAIHYGATGLPDSWASNTVNLAMNIAIPVFLVVLFLIIPVILKVIPASLVNLPNRKYWLSAERKEATIEHMSQQLNIFGVVIMFLLIALEHLTYKANMTSPVRLNEKAAWVIFISFMVFTIAWLFKFYKRYRLPRN